MAKNYYYRKQKGNGWKRFGALALATVVTAGALATIGVGSQGFKNWDVQTWFQQSEVGKTTATTGGAIISESSNNDIIKVMATEISSDDYESNGISSDVEKAFQITVTVLPEDATNKKVDYALAWKNPSSSWASGKSVTDYVTVTPESDGALTAIVANKQAFGEQIILTVTSRSNSSASAECQIDYQQKDTFNLYLQVFQSDLNSDWGYVQSLRYITSDDTNSGADTEEEVDYSGVDTTEVISSGGSEGEYFNKWIDGRNTQYIIKDGEYNEDFTLYISPDDYYSAACYVEYSDYVYTIAQENAISINQIAFESNPTTGISLNDSTGKKSFFDKNYIGKLGISDDEGIHSYFDTVKENAISIKIKTTVNGTTTTFGVRPTITKYVLNHEDTAVKSLTLSDSSLVF
jgi:hypothetical protein